MYVNAPRTRKRSTTNYTTELLENGNGTAEMDRPNSAYLYKDGTVIKRRVLDSAGSATTNTVATTDGTETLSGKTVTGLALTAGTTTVAPLTFASGTNLTTPVSGSVEYDSRRLQLTVGSQRGTMSNSFFHCSVPALAGGTVSSQSFPTFTCPVSGTYLVDLSLNIQASSGGASSTIAFSLSSSSGSTTGVAFSALSTSPTAVMMTPIAQQTNTGTTTIDTASSVLNRTVHFKGLFYTAAAGTVVTPKITFNVAQWTTCSSLFFVASFTPINASSLFSDAPWA